MLPCNGVSRIKLKRDSFKQNNKLEPNKRRWTRPKTVSGLNPLADRGIQVQGQDSSPAPEAADVVSTERKSNEICATADPEPPCYFDRQASSKQDDHAEHDDFRGRYNQGTFPSRVSGFSICEGGIPKAQAPCTRSRSTPTKTLKRLSEHKKEFFYRLRLALCFARKKHTSGGKRVMQGPTGTPCRAPSYINSKVSVESDNIYIKSTVCEESVDQTPPVQLDPGSPDYLRQENQKPCRGRKPRKLFIDHFGGSDGQVKTTIKTEVRRDHASKARPTVSGQIPNISSKVELRRQLRSDTRKDRKRLVKNSCCALCGDVKYTPRPSKNQTRLLNHKSRAGRPSPTAWQKGVCHISESRRPPTTPIFHFEKYPMVKMCDVARVFDIASHDFTCVLPAVLRKEKKCKRMRCLKKEFSFLVHPYLHGIRKQRSKIANQSWEVSTPTHSCASFSSGDPLSGATGSTYISDTAETPDGSVKEWDACLARNPDFEKMRQTGVERTASVLPLCDDNGPVVCFFEKDKACPMKNISESPSSPVRRVPPLVLRRVTVNGFGFRNVNEHCGLSLDEEEEEEDSRNEDSDSEVNSPESFSCQRTQAYIFFPQSSCARTSKIWPFPRMCPPNQLRPSHQTGPRWIVNTSFPATDQISLGVEPECLSDKDVQNKLPKPTKQSKSSDKAREVLEGQLLSSAPGERPPTNMLAVLGRTSNQAENLNKSRGTLTEDIFHISKLPDNTTCSALDKKQPTCTQEKTWKGLVDSPKVILTHVSKPAELESNQSLKKDFEDTFEDAPEYSAPLVTEQVNNYKLNGLGYAVSSEGSSLLKNQSLLWKSNQKVLSNGSDVSDNRKDETLPIDSLDPKPVSQTSRALSFEDQEENKNGGRQTLYNPGSLSKICLKAQHSLVTTSSLVDQKTKSVTPNSVAYTPDSNPACSGEWKRTQVFNSYTDSFSEDENKNATSLSSDEESGEHHAAESLWSGDDGTCRIKDKEQGSTPPPLPVVTESFLDVSRAYEEDVLILDVIQDDPELFGAVDAETASKRDAENEETHLKTESILQTGNHCKIVWDLKTDCISESHPTAADIKMENVKDGSSVTVEETEPAQSMNALKLENATDCNNNQEMKETNNLNAITVINTRAASLVKGTCSNGCEVTANVTANVTAKVTAKATAKESSTLRTLNVNYCWYYFSEYNTCMRSICWFPHIPRDGDEKFCMDTVKKFCHVGKHALVLRAVEVFMGYYNKCSPSANFNQETVNSLLSSLLNMCLLREFEAVVYLLLRHKRLPPPEIILAVFKLVRERGLNNTVPELILLTSKIVEAGCVFTVDQCEVMQSHLQMMQVPRQQMDIFLAVKCRALATNPHTSELSDLAQAVVRVEMLKHQNDWAGLALVFCGVCVGSHSPTELLRFCCCVTMALLKEPKDKLALPYELFAESVCQHASSNEMIKNILGRIGVSLIFRYHRTQEWNKGVKLVSVMFRLHIEFITLKGIMGNEHGVSRCQLVTLATELFLHSGSIEGALKMLRADGWFVSSSMWPCEQADIESRKHVLTLLAEKTSNRDTFEILTNLPGLRQPINGVQINDYTEMFSAHLRICMIKQTLPVAADIVEFMLIQGMVPETLQLQNLIHKLGKQNNWSRARALFKRARSVGFYTAVVCEREGLFLPCSLTEIEMTLAFEMFITFINTNQLAPAASSQPLLITLRRHAGVEDVTESVYLAAGCRLLSAALIPNPKLSIRYTAVNQSQEQLFQLDRGSAHKWFLQNDRWAQEIWAS